MPFFRGSVVVLLVLGWMLSPSKVALVWMPNLEGFRGCSLFPQVLWCTYTPRGDCFLSIVFCATGKVEKNNFLIQNICI